MKEQEIKTIELDKVEFIIPECCREGWDSCVHCVKKTEKKKKNIAL